MAAEDHPKDSWGETYTITSMVAPVATQTTFSALTANTGISLLNTGRYVGLTGGGPSGNVFVAYPYAINEDDYRGVFRSLEKAFDVKFTYADEKITSKHLLDKIIKMIAEARLCLFDVTYNNPNVLLELGVALGLGARFYVVFNPESAGHDPVTDIKGFDRGQYVSFASLKELVSRLLLQEGVQPRQEAPPDPMEAYRSKAQEYVRDHPRAHISAIASHLGVNSEMAGIVVRPLVAEKIFKTEGQTRATKYSLA